MVLPFCQEVFISIHALREEGDVDGDARTAQIL